MGPEILAAWRKADCGMMQKEINEAGLIIEATAEQIEREREMVSQHHRADVIRRPSAIMNATILVKGFRVSPMRDNVSRCVPEAMDLRGER